jgi:hypothetical protein
MPKTTKRYLNEKNQNPTSSKTSIFNSGTPFDFGRLLRSRDTDEKKAEISKWTNFEDINKRKKKKNSK